MSTQDNPVPDRVLVADTIEETGIEMLRAGGLQVDVKTDLSAERLLQIIGDYQALIVRSKTKVGSSIIEKAFNLKVIARAGAGLDNIDVVAARTQGIEVINAPNAYTLAVAEHTLGLILALARHLPKADQSLKLESWDNSTLVGTGLAGKTLGIIGFGRIGRQVAQRAHAFGMRVVVNQRRLTPELALAEGVEALDLREMLKKSDFVSLHVPSRPDTMDLIGAAELAIMKEEAFLINTARGDVVDEAALLAALNGKKIAGVALDVFSQEPAIDNALVQHPRVIATPHIAASTGDAQRAASITVAEQILEILAVSENQLPFSLQILPLSHVLPHEQTDPERVARLRERLREDNILKNPPIVAEWCGSYVVLDGATRVTALKEMEFNYIMAQVISPERDSFDLKTWSHIKRGMSAQELLSLVQSLPSIKAISAELSIVQDSMLEFGGLCYLVLANKDTYIIKAAGDTSRLDALNEIVSAYIRSGQVSRTISTNFDSIRAMYPDMAGLFVFPNYTIDQILQIAQAGKVVPAGITRFVIPGRVLRVNLDLDRLEKEESLVLKSMWLKELVNDLYANHRVRYYEEPLYLLDE